MNLTRRQFNFGILAGIAVLIFGKLFGLGRGRAPDEGNYIEARHWRQADHLAG